MSEWSATTEAELVEISGVIHDSWFDSEMTAYDEAAKTVTVEFGQTWEWSPLQSAPEWHGAPATEVVRQTWRYTEERVPFMRGVLRIHHVLSLSSEPEWGDARMLSTVTYDETSGCVDVVGVSGNLTAVVSALQVTTELMPQEVAFFVRRRRGLFGGASEKPLWP